MNEFRARILLGIFRGETIPEIANALDTSSGYIHDSMVWLRDQGYIKPWIKGAKRGKELTDDGMAIVFGWYGKGVDG